MYMNVAIWIVLGLVAWTLGLWFVMILMRMAGDEDRAALRQEKLLEAFSDGGAIQPGIGRFVRIEPTWRDLDAAGTAVAWHLEWRDAA